MIIILGKDGNVVMLNLMLFGILMYGCVIKAIKKINIFVAEKQLFEEVFFQQSSLTAIFFYPFFGCKRQYFHRHYEYHLSIQ